MLIRVKLPASDEEARANLVRIVAEHDEDYADLATLVLGRSAGYLTRYVKKGSPRALAGDDRDNLARYFRVPVETFGGTSPVDPPKPAYVKPPLRARA